MKPDKTNWNTHELTIYFTPNANSASRLTEVETETETNEFQSHNLTWPMSITHFKIDSHVKPEFAFFFDLCRPIIENANVMRKHH